SSIVHDLEHFVPTQSARSVHRPPLAPPSDEPRPPTAGQEQRRVRIGPRDAWLVKRQRESRPSHRWLGEGDQLLEPRGSPPGIPRSDVTFDAERPEARVKRSRYNTMPEVMPRIFDNISLQL